MIPLRLGFIPLTDCATLAVAVEKGFFARQGLEVTLSREPSWANIRDKVAVGALDGAQMLAGMPLAANLGIDPLAEPLVAALSLGLNGNAITVSNEVWEEMREADPEALATRPIHATALRRVIEERRRRRQPALRFAMVYPFATHNYELRYWLAAAGIDPDEDVDLAVVPPPRMVEALAAKAIDGFCVGEPWNSLAVQRGLGRIVISKYEIWNNSPEKVLAVRQRFAERRPEVHQALLRALIQAAAWADAAEHRREVSRLLAEARYVGAPEPLLVGSLSGRLFLGPEDVAATMPDFHVFHRWAASFPWTSHAMWQLLQMLRWGQLSAPINVLAVARDAYRPDLYREAARELGLPAPETDLKSEGTHSSPWILEGPRDGAIEMGPDRFVDGREFHPSHVIAYLTACGMTDLEALAALNP